MSRRKTRRRSCFTLMEMVIVIAILGLLGGIAVPAYFQKLEKAKKQTAKTQIGMIEQAILDFQIDTGRLPKSLDELIKNPGEKKWNGPYLQKVSEVPKDPWGKEYVLTIPGAHGEFDIISYGKDGLAGGSGNAEDIGNWVQE